MSYYSINRDAQQFWVVSILPLRQNSFYVYFAISDVVGLFCARLPRLLDSSVDRAQRIVRSAALVLGSILAAASVCFDSDSCDLGLTIRLVKTVE